MTTLRELVLKIHEDLNDNLNTYIGSTQGAEEDWFEDLSFVDYAPDWETEKDWFKMGIPLKNKISEKTFGKKTGKIRKDIVFT